jgi:hypothetical protein
MIFAATGLWLRRRRPGALKSVIPPYSMRCYLPHNADLAGACLGCKP